MSARKATPILYADDAMASAAWYGKLGFEVEFTHRFDHHSPLFVGLVSGDAGIMLSEHRGDAVPNGLVYVVRSTTSTQAAAALGVQAEDREWGIREAHAVDPGGNRVRIAQHEEPAQR